MRVEVHISEIVLIGPTLPAGGEAQLRMAVQRELTERFTAAAPSPRLLEAGRVPHLAAAEVRVPPGPASPARLGRDLSRSLHQALTR